MSQRKTTTDHAIIRKWAEAHGGGPARVRNTGSGDDLGILHLDFGDPDVGSRKFSGANFSRSELARLYQCEGETCFAKLI